MDYSLESTISHSLFDHVPLTLLAREDVPYAQVFSEEDDVTADEGGLGTIASHSPSRSIHGHRVKVSPLSPAAETSSAAGMSSGIDIFGHDFIGGEQGEDDFGAEELEAYGHSNGLPTARPLGFWASEELPIDDQTIYSELRQPQGLSVQAPLVAAPGRRGPSIEPKPLFASGGSTPNSSMMFDMGSNPPSGDAALDQPTASSLDQPVASVGVGLEQSVDSTSQARRVQAKAARAAAKARWLEKRKRRKFGKGHTHYMERRVAASSRKRVGGRFAKKGKRSKSTTSPATSSDGAMDRTSSAENSPKRMNVEPMDQTVHFHDSLPGPQLESAVLPRPIHTTTSGVLPLPQAGLVG